MIQKAIALRKKLEPWFATLDAADVEKLAVILRVDGSLGSFGPEGVENIAVEDGAIECDVVIADQGWENLADHEISKIINERVLQGIRSCLSSAGISYDDEALAGAAAAASGARRA